MEKLHLIMPMGGRGYRFFKDGYSMPKPLIELNGKPFFYWSAQSVMKFVDVADISLSCFRSILIISALIKRSGNTIRRHALLLFQRSSQGR